MSEFRSYRSVDTYPAELLLTINKATTVSWRLGVAWTLISDSGKVLTCNGNLFNQHNQTLLDDLQTFSNAKKLYISYCPLHTDLYAEELFDALRFSTLVELHVYTHYTNKKAVSDLFNSTAIPSILWPSDKTQLTQTNGIAWVRSTDRPWVHIICANSFGGGTFPEKLMSETLGVIPYVTLKGIESSLLYVQKDRSISFRTQLQMADPKFVKSSELMIEYLNSFSAAAVSVVTVVCDPSWLADIIRMNLANEVSYFLTLRSEIEDSLAIPHIVDFPESDKWRINSSEVMGNFIQIVLQKGMTASV